MRPIIGVRRARPTSASARGPLVRTHGALKRRLSDERGFSLIELLVAMVLLTIGLLAAVRILDGSATAILAAQRHEQAVSLGQREIERLHAYSYADLDLSSLPTPGTSGTVAGESYAANPRNPNYWLSGTGTSMRLLVKTDYNNTASTTPAGVNASGELLVDDVANTGTPPVGISPGPETVTVGTTQMTVYRYVSWRNDPRCPTTVAGCSTEKDSKRITVAVVVTPSGSNALGPTRPIWFSSVVTPPA